MTSGGAPIRRSAEIVVFIPNSDATGYMDVPTGTCTGWYTPFDAKARAVGSRGRRAHPRRDRRPVAARHRRGRRDEPPDADPPFRLTRRPADRGRPDGGGAAARLPGDA